MKLSDAWNAYLVNTMAVLSANLITGAFVWLVANGSGLVTRAQTNVVTVAVAFVVITTAFYFGLFYRAAGLEGSGENVSWTPILGVAATLWFVGLVLEVIAVFRAAGPWTTVWVTIVSIVGGSLPALAVQGVREWRRKRTKTTVTSQ